MPRGAVKKLRVEERGSLQYKSVGGFHVVTFNSYQLRVISGGTVMIFYHTALIIQFVCIPFIKYLSLFKWYSFCTYYLLDRVYYEHFDVVSKIFLP